MLFAAFLRGLGLGAGLIVAIGAQNTFVLRQGLKREGRLTVALVCTACDAALIALGAGGFGGLIARAPWLTHLAAWTGALFLLFYGLSAFRRALRPLAPSDDTASASRGSLVATTLGLSLLNPHVFLDTVVLIGGLSAQYPLPARAWFAGGAMTASALWFFGLAYGAALLAPLFRRPVTWRVLDGLIGCVMWAIAASLLLPAARASAVVPLSRSCSGAGWSRPHRKTGNAAAKHRADKSKYAWVHWGRRQAAPAPVVRVTFGGSSWRFPFRSTTATSPPI